MATSGTSTGLLTAGEVVKTAYELQGVFGPEDDITADRMDTGIKHANWLLKSWQADGCSLWRDEDVSIAFPASALGEGELSANYLDLFNVRLVQSGYNRPLTRIEREEFSPFQIRAQTGIPSLYCPYRQRDTLWLKLWPVPSVDVVLLANVARVVEDVTGPDQTIDIPQEWTECLFFNVADRLMPSTGLWAKEPATAKMIAGRAAEFYRKMSDFDRPLSYTLGMAHR